MMPTKNSMPVASMTFKRFISYLPAGYMAAVGLPNGAGWALWAAFCRAGRAIAE
jgi:hypothetical protein